MRRLRVIAAVLVVIILVILAAGVRRWFESAALVIPAISHMGCDDSCRGRGPTKARA